MSARPTAYSTDYASPQARIPFIPRDFTPIEATNVEGGYKVRLVPKLDQWILISPNGDVDWSDQFPTGSNSKRMWLVSLDFVGRMAALAAANRDIDIARLALRVVAKFAEYASTRSGRVAVDKLPSSGDHAAATRIKALVKLWLVAQDFQIIDASDAYVINQEVLHSARWLEQEEHFHRNNHGVMASISLMVAGRFLNPTVGGWAFDLGAQRVALIAKEHFDSDGLCNENTIGYHNFNLSLYSQALRFIDRCGGEFPAREQLRETLAKAENALSICIRQDSTVPPIGDSPVYKLRKVSVNRSHAFYDSGFAVIKNEDLYLSLICGSRTESHKQVDDSSFTLRYRGIDIVIDGGSFSYDRASGFGRYIASSVAHSGIFPDSLDYVRRRELVSRHGRVDGKIVSLVEDSNGAKLTARYSLGDWFFAERTVNLTWPATVAVRDRVADRRKTGGVMQRTLLGPELDLQPCGYSIELHHPSVSGHIRYSRESPPPTLFHGQESPNIRGWYSVNFGEIEPTWLAERRLAREVTSEMWIHLE